MQHSPQIFEMLSDLREDELRRINPHRFDALSTPRDGGVRASIAGAIVRVGLMLDGDAGRRETDRRASHNIRSIIAPEGDPVWHW